MDTPTPSAAPLSRLASIGAALCAALVAASCASGAGSGERVDASKAPVTPAARAAAAAKAAAAPPTSPLVPDAKGDLTNAQGERWPGARDGTVRPTAVRWTDQGALLIGYQDGLIVRHDPDSAKTQARRMFSEDAKKRPLAPVSAFSNDGHLAALGDAPMHLVELERNEIIIQLHKIKSVAATAFASDASRWYVSEPDGTVHVWTRARLLAPSKGEDIRSVIQRAAPDFSAQMPDLKPPLYAVGPAGLYFNDGSNTINYWDLSTQELHGLFSFRAPIRAMATSDRYLAATDTAGSLRVLDRKSGRLVQFQGSNAKAALTGELTGFTRDAKQRLFVVRDDALTAFDINPTSLEAAQVWTRPLPPGGALCGLAVHTADTPLALCVNDTIALLRPDHGGLIRTLRNLSGEATLRDRTGAKVTAPK